MGTTEKEIQGQLRRFERLSLKLDYQLQEQGINRDAFPIIEQKIKLEDSRADFIAAEFKHLNKSNPELAKKLVESEKRHIAVEEAKLEDIGRSDSSKTIRNMVNKNLVELENIRSDFISAITDPSAQEAHQATSPKGKPKGRH